MMSSKWSLAGVPLALLAAGCIIVPGHPSAVSYGSGTYGSGPYGGSSGYPRVDSPRPAASAAPREATVPIIAALTASPTTLTRPGQEVVFHIEAVDASGTPAYTWTATGGTLTSTAGTRVSWRSPDKPGRYTILVVVTSPSGGATTGAVNIEVGKDGSGQVVPESPPGPSPSPAPAATPTPTPTPAPPASSEV